MIDLKALMSRMTLEDKASLCASPDFYHTRGIERLGIPSLVLADGANGVRRHVESDEAQMDDRTFPAVCFPSGATIACSWDRSLLLQVGEALGETALILGVDVLLGPAINIKRSPLCGRNFEYYSEDPFLSSALATSYIKGVQSKGIGTSIKHFAANNQEYKRMSVDVRVDERTLREIYLASFEAAVIEAQPWTVMCAYNQINGAYCSENGFLLNDVLRKEWKFEGAVMSDWGAVADREKGITAGLDLEMPTSYGYGDRRILNAISDGSLSEADLDKTVERLLRLAFRAAQNRKTGLAYEGSAHETDKIAR